MAYPTGIVFQPTNGAPMGMQPINESSVYKRHELGTRVSATDPTYGEGVFVYLIGVASTAAGDVCCYNSSSGATVRAVAGGATTLGPVAIAMSDNVASQYGWYCISGAVPVKAATVAANTQAYLTSTAAQVDDASSTAVNGMSFKAATSSGFATAQLSSPSVAPITETFSGDVTVGTLTTTGDVAVGANKVTVAAASGNTAVAGTLDVTGNLAVNTNKFTVAASSGNAVVAGTLGVTGNVTMTAASHTITNNATSSKNKMVYTSAFATGAGGPGDAAHYFAATVSSVTQMWADFGAGILAIAAMGNICFGNIGDSSASPGNATIDNCPIGKCAVASAASAVTITSNLVTTGSFVWAWFMTASDPTVVVHSVVPGSGSFVITLNAVVTGNRTLGFLIFNR